jgi:hypothetical protein
MIDQGGNQYASNDGDGLLKASGQDEGKKLGLVADFREGDDTNRYE